MLFASSRCGKTSSPRRASLAVPELVLPELTVCEAPDGRVRIGCRSGNSGFGHVLVGILRTLADDYGALVSDAERFLQGKTTVIQANLARDMAAAAEANAAPPT